MTCLSGSVCVHQWLVYQLQLVCLSRTCSSASVCLSIKDLFISFSLCPSWTCLISFSLFLSWTCLSASVWVHHGLVYQLQSVYIKDLFISFCLCPSWTCLSASVCVHQGLVYLSFSLSVHYGLVYLSFSVSVHQGLVYQLQSVSIKDFLCPKRNFGRHIVIALSVRQSVRVSARVSVRPASCPVHISYILWGRNSKFGVWMHLGMTECRVTFSGHCDLDLWPSF